MQIACDFHWEMGHRIPDHVGLCKNLHGHSYRMRVTIEGDVQPSGMIIDFFDVKKLIMPIVDSLDHAFLCDERDALMHSFLQQHAMKMVLVSFPTTVENLTQYMLDALRTPLSRYPHLRKVTVRIRETTSSFAEASTVFKFDAA